MFDFFNNVFPGISESEKMGLVAVLSIAIVALLYALFLVFQTLKYDKGTSKIQSIANSIKVGANAYLKVQFRRLAPMIILLSIALYFTTDVGLGRSAAFIMGCIFSAVVGYVGMNMAIQGTMRVTSAAKKGSNEALKIAYRSGTITGMLTDGLGLLGGTLLFTLYGKIAPEVLLGFGFGGTMIALLMRVGGGIYTKAADVGADLVGKVEKGMPEDDPRNAAVIADLVGDNVGDCAGMAADIFESYEVTIVSALILGLAIMSLPGRATEYKWIIFPLIVRGIGVISSIIGTFAVSKWKTSGDAFKAMDLSYDLSSTISTVSFFLLAWFYVNDASNMGLRVFGATAMGIVLAVGFNKLTSYFTNPAKPPVKHVVKSAETGAATVILTGLSVGFESTVWAIFLIGATIIISYLIFLGYPIIFAFYGVSLAGIGMLSHTGNNVSMDAFGPISDNASGIGEMAGIEPEERHLLADLDSAGNTTKAITKGIAIASAVLAAVSLFGSFLQVTKIAEVGLAIDNPLVFVGMLAGGAMPFLFSALTIKAVGRAASRIIEEVRRQFHVPGVIEGKVLPDYARVVTICTSAAQKELLSLSVLAVLTPIAIGLILEETALAGFLAGIILTGQLLAVFMANSGGAWDNAKKVIERSLGGKGSTNHKASVVGDTVGDPLKDASGPALNPMIKVINLVSLILAPLIVANKILNVETLIIGTVLVLAIAVAVWYSKKETVLLKS
jgi:K(+)-stimulated pyrophosphate-energized sodium pump